MAQGNKKKLKTKKENKFKSFYERSISGIVLVALLVILLLLGGNVLLVSLAILSCIALMELFDVFKLNKTLFSYLGISFVIFYYITIYYYSINGILLFLIAFLILLLSFYVFSFPKYTIKEVALVIYGVIYVAIMFSFVYLIRNNEVYGKYIVWLIFISSWGSDTFAYLTGMLFGKHKLVPNLSPKKTVEGAIGGIIGSMLLGAIYTYIVFNKLTDDIYMSSVRVSIGCGVGSIISMIGDLTASGIKRNYDVKDYGNIIPGHGGILDRFDSVIFTAPALYFILNLFR